MIQKLPLGLTKDERDAFKNHSLLVIRNKQISDPLKAADGWLDEVHGPNVWPPCLSADISEYLLGRDEKLLLHRLCNDYNRGVKLQSLEGQCPATFRCVPGPTPQTNGCISSSVCSQVSRVLLMT
ncbi:hypothetical protein XENOCAPTIV_023221 [Xenoophorus captivus]|uniref:Uncharacterized protein n=1 Tax=Xenoophorus captivus TaxID=1517983 RepID=A0ABV0SAQ1_9TELE